MSNSKSSPVMIKGVDPVCCQADPTRRAAVKLMAGTAIWSVGIRPVLAADDGPHVGDFLVRDDDDSKSALKPADLKLNERQILVYPQDPKTGAVKSDSRLNRIIIMKLDPGALDPDTAKNAADGIVAYSGVCVHQSCDVSGWSAKDQELLCVCHYSKFSPLRSGEVTGGPAPRPLPSLPIKVANGKIVIAGAFSTKPGGSVG